MSVDSPVAIIFNTDGYEVSIKDGYSIPAAQSSFIASGKDGSTNRFISVNSSGNPIIVGAGSAGSPSGGVITIQGVVGGTAIPVSGSISNASIGTNNSAIPSSSTQIGGSDGTNLQVPKVFDLDTGAGTDYNLGISLRLPASGGSVVGGTSSNPLRIDTTGTTTQPISAVSLPLPTGAATETTLSTLLLNSTFTSRINTLGQKTMANSTPVVLASDQSNINIVGVGAAGSPSGGVLSVQGVSGATPISFSQRELATFTALATGTAIANNKSMFSIVNASGSTVVCKIQAIYITNVQTTAVTGVIGTFELRRIVNHSAGTAITLIEKMDSNDSLNASITVRTGSTVTSESTTLLWRNLFSTDEWGVGGADVESNDHIFQSMFPIWTRFEKDTKPITLRANEGLTVKFATNSTAGTFDILVVFTQE